jgi:ribosomal protein S18 acetylase RimI-like enzyme
MGKLVYFKRYRMELHLRHPRPPAELPPGFFWVAWERSLLEAHAQVKFRCFRGEMDADVFPALGHLSGCRELMTAIVGQRGFSPQATWLVGGPDGAVGTVQGLFDPNRVGGIQNLGVVPECRGLGIGRALLLKALEGFVAAGASRAFLEVTAKNDLAVRMYRRLGFRSCQTIYRGVELGTTREARPAEAVGVGQ